MDDLIAFLNARLDEDEAAAKAVRPDQDYADSAHQERWSPARVLFEVAAKRLLLDWHKPVLVDGRNADGDEFSSYQCMECDTGGVRDNWPCRTVLALAAVYSDHPDYRDEWATGS